jgi:putative ABC transport system substrate-binding protein
MAQLGWIDGKNFVLEFRDAHGNPKELDAIMQALVESNVDLIVAMCTPEGLAAKKFTSTIPIVLAATGDPVAAAWRRVLRVPEATSQEFPDWS